MSPWFKGGSNDLLADLLTQQGLQADDGGHRGSGSRRGLGVEELIRTSLSTWKPRGKSNKNYIQLLPAKTKSIKKAEKQVCFIFYELPIATPCPQEENAGRHTGALMMAG